MPNLMIVDDEPLARFSLHTIISQAFEDVSVVAEVENGPDAIAAYERWRPDVVLMDVRLPGMSGITASERILERFPTAKIVICTAYDNFSFISHALDIGVKGFLLKPVRRDELVQKLEKLFASTPSIIEQLAEQKMLEQMLCGKMSGERMRQLEQYYSGLDAGMLLVFECANESAQWSILNKLAVALPNGKHAFRCVLEGRGCLLASQSRSADSWNQLMETFAAEKPRLKLRWAACCVRSNRWSEAYVELCQKLDAPEEAAPPQESIGRDESLAKTLLDKLNFPDSEIDNMSLNKLADELGVTSQYLSVAFKEALGITFISYMTQRRMNYAARLLRESDLSVAEVAQQCGYSDLTYFKRLFKKTFGLSPKDCAHNKN